MNILHINTQDNVGGAARAMYRLHKGLQWSGHMSQLLVGHQTRLEPDIGSINRQAGPFRTAADKMLDRIGLQLERWWGIDKWSYRNSWHIPQTPFFRQADVINLHNLHGGYLNLRVLPELARHKPMVWTLHDMWALTGHCAYSYDCERWRSGCYDCPLLKEPGRQTIEPKPTPTDRTRRTWSMKRGLYERSPLYIVTPSKWLQKLVEGSILADSLAIQCIPYGLDLASFRPLEQATARRALDIPHEARVVMFMAYDVVHGRKGFDYLLDALAGLADTDSIYLLTIGNHDRLEPQAERFRLRTLGYLSDERLQRLAYTAADAFVFPTLADNQPLVLIEAMACGTPLISFNVGGVSEIVRHMETGYLARYKDAADLAQGIQLLLDDASLRGQLGRRCREIAEIEYALGLQAQRYVEVYERAVEACLRRRMPFEQGIKCHIGRYRKTLMGDKVGKYPAQYTDH